MQGWCSKWHHWHIHPITTKKYQEDIFGVEQRSGSRLPGVECGASFSDMSAGTQYSYQFFVVLIFYPDHAHFFLTSHSDYFHLFFCWIGLERLADFLEATQEIWERSRNKMKINQFFDKSISWSVFSFPTDLEIQESLFPFCSHLWVQVMLRSGIYKWRLRDETSVNIHLTPMFGVKKWCLSTLHHPLFLYFYYHSWLWWRWCQFQGASAERIFFNPSSKLQQT